MEARVGGHLFAVVSSPQPQSPHAAYALILGTFAAGLVTAGAVARKLRRDPQCQTALDFAVLAAASFKAARTLTHDRVASVVRDPFVEGEAHEGDERPAGRGLQRAVGELVTCTRCVGTWTAAGLAATQIVAPRFGRLLTWSLGAAAANDFLQAGFVALNARANDEASRQRPAIAAP